MLEVPGMLEAGTRVTSVVPRIQPWVYLVGDDPDGWFPCS